MEFLNGLTGGTETNSNSKGLILLVLIAVIVFGFGKNGGLNTFGVREDGHRHHHHRRKACNCPGGVC